jgi:hypothetical protein
MLNLLLILALSGVIVISAGFAGVTFMQGVQSSLDAEITTQRLLDVATQVQSHLRYLDPAASGNYIMALPAGTTGDAPYAYNQVPAFITSNARGANGVPFEYCPYAQSNDSLGDQEGAISMPNGTYPAGTYNWTTESSSSFYGGNDTASQKYVVDNNGGSPPTGFPPISANTTYGFLVAAAPNQFYPPDCTSVTSSGAYAKISGGTVIPINNDYLNKMRVAGSMTDFHFYVSTAATVAAQLTTGGDGSGRDTSNYMTLPDALTIIQTIKPASAMIYVDATGSPTYNLTTTKGTSFNNGTRIYLEGINGSGTTVNTSGDILIDEYNMLSIGNLTLEINGGSGTMTVNGTLEMTDSSPTLQAATVQVYGGAIKGYSNATNSYTSTMTINGNVIVDGGGVITSSGPMVFTNLSNRGFEVINGHVYGGTTMQFTAQSGTNVPIIIKAGGDMIAGSGLMTITASGGGMIIDPGGRFFGATNSSCTASGCRGSGSSVLISGAQNYGFYVHGEMDLAPQSATVAVDYSNSPPTDGIILASGGKFQLEATAGVSLGTSAHKPTVGILDAGGGGFYTAGSTGNNIIYASSNCWQGSNSTNLFTDSTGTDNSTTAVTTTFPGGFYRLYNNSHNLVCN